MAADMGPYSAIENTEFKDMVKVLEPCYKEPSHVHVSQYVVLPCINQHKLQLLRNYQVAVLQWSITDILCYLFLLFSFS